jgi:hypothetical protein
MGNVPVIAFGQQPCGFFPRRFLYAKVRSARRLQAEIGGEIVFFCHDSDHDPRETRTVLRHRTTGHAVDFNFAFENKVQRKYSPMHHKRIVSEWCEVTARQLQQVVEARWVDVFRSIRATTVAEFCLEMYRCMGLLDGIRVVRSSDADFRRKACDVDDFFVDLPFEGETVRARHENGRFHLHPGGDARIEVPAQAFSKEQVSAARDTRFRWMQSVLCCTHYIAGAGEQAYLRMDQSPDVRFVAREIIDRPEEAHVEHTV